MSGTVKQLTEKFLAGQFDGLLKELYIDESIIDEQRNRYVEALKAFQNLYREKEVEIYSAPGRSEIGGNHTDHQNGRVLAASINLDAIAIAAKTEDSIVHVKSEGYEPVKVDLSRLEPVESEQGTTAALIRGVANGVKVRGYEIGGFEAYVTSSVLTGSGLSSSAAYEVLIGNILSGLYNDDKIDAITIAQIGQEAENVHFGKPCGLMDQMACSVGGMISIDFADKKHPKVKKVDVAFGKLGHCLCIVDTKGSHADLTDEYAAIPEEMKRVAGYFGKKLLCEIGEAEFYQNLADIRKATGDRAVLRALHWFEENHRVDEQVESLEKGDFNRFKQLIKASGDSSYKYLQNVFSVKNTEEQSMSLALAMSALILKDKGVSRVHGGGFAGTIQAFVPTDIVNEYKQSMESIFGNNSCHVLQIRPYGGRKIV